MESSESQSVICEHDYEMRDAVNGNSEDYLDATTEILRNQQRSVKELARVSRKARKLRGEYLRELSRVVDPRSRKKIADFVARKSGQQIESIQGLIELPEIKQKTAEFYQQSVKEAQRLIERLNIDVVAVQRVRSRFLKKYQNLVCPARDALAPQRQDPSPKDKKKGNGSTDDKKTETEWTILKPPYDAWRRGLYAVWSHNQGPPTVSPIHDFDGRVGSNYLSITDHNSESETGGYMHYEHGTGVGMWYTPAKSGKLVVKILVRCKEATWNLWQLSNMPFVFADTWIHHQFECQIGDDGPTKQVPTYIRHEPYNPTNPWDWPGGLDNEGGYAFLPGSDHSFLFGPSAIALPAGQQQRLWISSLEVCTTAYDNIGIGISVTNRWVIDEVHCKIV